MIAEYLASKGIDGVLYVSSLVDRPQPSEKDGLIRLRPEDDKGVNIVLFAHASVVINDLGEPAYEVANVDEPWSDDDLSIHTQYVETKPRDPKNDGAAEYPLIGDALEPTLRLRKQLVVAKVRRIRYTFVKHDVRFFTKATKADEGDDPF